MEDYAECSPCTSSPDAASPLPSPPIEEDEGSVDPTEVAVEKPGNTTEPGMMSSVDKALFRASTDGDAEAAAEALKARANPNAVYRAGMGPLHMACWQGHEEIVVRLLSANADPAALNDKG